MIKSAFIKRVHGSFDQLAWRTKINAALTQLDKSPVKCQPALAACRDNNHMGFDKLKR
ncbi:hypothetical protein ACFO1S_24990 [Cohnella boryungensis]|uniref:Uncharacterized protein n=1 Tax=Cohnella boryungensis TaxID=768479 RepID=A0ABV8SH81_9BACL